MSENNEQLLGISIGKIDPSVHIANDEYSLDEVNNYCQLLINDQTLYQPMEISTPIHCADGRTTLTNGMSLIGGSFSVVMCDSLGPQKYLQNNEAAQDHAARVYGQLQANNQPIGGHDDDQAITPNCGCGGEDRLQQILSFIVSDYSRIVNWFSQLKDSRTGDNLGINMDASDMQIILDHCQLLMTNNYVSSGQQLRQSISNIAGNNSIEKLHGQHQEVVAVIDLRRDGYVLNRDQLRSKTTPLMQAFYVNIASIEYIAKLLYLTEVEKRLAIAAGLVFNIAATAVLSGPNLRIITLT